MNLLPQFSNEMLPRSDPHAFFAGDGTECTVHLVVDGLGKNVRLDSTSRPFVVIGRSADCDVTLPDANVSHRHASLQLVRGGVFCVDLMSRTGTFWGSERRRSGWLLPGGRLKIGPYTIAYPQNAETPNAGALIPAEPAETNLLGTVEPFDVEFSFLNGQGHPGSRWRMNAPVVLVGKSKRCRLSLDHSSVSRVHCSLTATPAGVWITDMLGRSGTWVNGQQVSQHLLRSDDVIRVGKFQFRVRYPQNRVEDQQNPSQPQVRPEEGAIGGNGLSENAVMTMMDRFSQMQQQMFEMSHQQMMMMTQLVGNIHHNYNDLARQELTRIQELEAQINLLRGEIGSDARSPAELADFAPQRLLDCRDDPSEVFPTVPTPTEESLPPELGEKSPEKTDGETAAGSVRNRFSEGDVESHALLIERMATLERERSSRWKKLMGLMTGSTR